jgi:hypothetical protein
MLFPPRNLRVLRASALSTPAAVLLLVLSLPAAVVDRIAVVVGNNVITESEVFLEVRLTEFLNQQPLDLSPAARRAAAERLVDQQLIRNEMITGHYPMPTDAEASPMLQAFRQENYPDEAKYRTALQKYGISEDDLKQHLLWQLATLRFTDLRFQTGLPNVQSANRLRAGSSEPDPDDVDHQLEAWLKETRNNTKVRFKPGAFQ